MGSHRVCAICGRDRHPSSHCPQLRPRICYECRSTGHFAQECRDMKAAEQTAREGAGNTVSPLDLDVGLKAEDLVSVDEWTEAGPAEGILDATPSRKRSASPMLPRPGPSRRYRSRSSSPEAGPSNFFVKTVEDQPSSADIRLHSGDE